LQIVRSNDVVAQSESSGRQSKGAVKPRGWRARAAGPLALVYVRFTESLATGDSKVARGPRDELR
jgi:hypothetical protein